MAGPGEVFFDGEVAIGDIFSAEGDFGAATYLHVYDNGRPLQTAGFDTSCAQPIVLGDVIAAATLVGYQGADGAFELALDAALPGAGALFPEPLGEVESDPFDSDLAPNDDLGAPDDDGFAFTSEPEEDTLLAA
jgi:hypothetical protein